MIPWPQSQFVAVLLSFVVATALIGIFTIGLAHLCQKKWRKGIVQLLLSGLWLVVCIGGLWALMLFSMFGPSEDHFSDNLSIPPNIDITEPAESHVTYTATKEDKFQQAVLGALDKAGNYDSSITATLPNLAQLQKKHTAILKRFLATSPAWRFYRENQAIFATRRWAINSHWRFSLHGYYSRFDVDRASENGIPDFQTRLTIGFSNKPWFRGNNDSTKLPLGETGPLMLKMDNGIQESHLIIPMDGLQVEVFEQSAAQERRITKTSLEFLEEELKPLAVSTTWETIQTLLPPGGIRQGKPVFDLDNGFQGGIYDSEMWLNPGEPGRIYLKAYEVTHGTPLSADRLEEASNEWIGWSDDPKQLFFANSTFTIYEGDWGKFYAARFEIWFAPDSGKPERKLMEKVFKIEGWQR